MSSLIDAASGASGHSAAASVGAGGTLDNDLYSQRRRYGVLVGGQRLLIGGQGAVRVLEPGPISRLPNTSAWFLGLTNIRSSMVPVYDLAQRQLLPVPGAGRMLLVIGLENMATAVLIDRPPRNLHVPEKTTELPSLHNSLAKHALHAFTLDGQVWTELDWNSLFSELKVAAVMVRGGASNNDA